MYRIMLKRWPKVVKNEVNGQVCNVKCQDTGSASRIRQTQKQATECKASDRLKPRAF